MSLKHALRTAGFVAMLVPATVMADLTVEAASPGSSLFRAASAYRGGARRVARRTARRTTYRTASRIAYNNYADYSYGYYGNPYSYYNDCYYYDYSCYY